MGAMDRREAETAFVGMREKVNEIVAASKKQAKLQKIMLLQLVTALCKSILNWVKMHGSCLVVCIGKYKT